MQETGPAMRQLPENLFDVATVLSVGKRDYQEDALTADFPEGEGLWQLGQFYERQGEDAKAADAYKKIEDAFSGKEDKDAQGGLAQRARSRLEAIKGAA